MIHVFILNHFAGRHAFADDLRKYLSVDSDIEYYIFTTRYAGEEKELVQRVERYFEGRKIRYYACGGSGTMFHMLNGVDDISKSEFAFFPLGMTNDFLKVFGEDQKYFEDIEKLVRGRVEKIDYIKTSNAIALNLFSVGIDEVMVNNMAGFRVFSFIDSKIPYLLAEAISVFSVKPVEYEVWLDDNYLEGRFCEIAFGNGCVMGGAIPYARKWNVTDGIGSYMIGKDLYGIKYGRTLSKIAKGRHDAVKDDVIFGESSKIRIRRKDGKPITMDCDGELVDGGSEWTAEIVRKGLSFVVPEEVSVHE